MVTGGSQCVFSPRSWAGKRYEGVFQVSKSIANLHGVLGIFCSNDKAAALSKQSLLDREREKRSKGICKKLPMTKGQRVGGGEEHEEHTQSQKSVYQKDSS